MSRLWHVPSPITIIMALVLSFAAAGFTAAAAAAENVQGSCDSSDESRVKLFENSIGDESDGDDRAWQCDWKSDLSNKPHTLEGQCADGSFGNGSWNDCISSVKPWTPDGKRFCAYEDADYAGTRGGWGPAKNGTRENVGSGLNDRISSVKWVDGGTCW